MPTQRNADGSRTEYAGNERITYDKEGNTTEWYVARTSTEREHLARQEGFVSSQAYAKYEAEKGNVDSKTREQLARDANIWDEETMGPAGCI